MGGCGEGSSVTMGTVLGTRPGATSLALKLLRAATEEGMLRGVDANGSADRRPRVIGVERMGVDGRPTVRCTGKRSSRPIINACSPNEIDVVQLRRAVWAHEVSSMLSPNIVSSSVKSACCYGHHENSSGRCCRKEKRPRYQAACWNFFDTKGVGLILFWR
jgi:hypothetical protein